MRHIANAKWSGVCNHAGVSSSEQRTVNHVNNTRSNGRHERTHPVDKVMLEIVGVLVGRPNTKYMPGSRQHLLERKKYKSEYRDTETVLKCVLFEKPQSVCHHSNLQGSCWALRSGIAQSKFE
jgi:hypothetical protein